MESRDKFVTSYVAHHWAASKGGLDLFERASRSQSSARTRKVLATLTREIAEDRARLRVMADALGVGEARLAQLALSVGETVSRVKLNGRFVRRSPLSDVLELEALLAAVRGTRAGWEGMRVLAINDARIDVAELDDLIVRADSQIERLVAAHAEAAATLR